MNQLHGIFKTTVYLGVLGALCLILIISPQAQPETCLNDQSTIKANRIIQLNHPLNNQGNNSGSSVIDDRDDFISVLPDFTSSFNLMTDQVTDGNLDPTAKSSLAGHVTHDIYKMNSRTGYHLQVQIYQTYDDILGDFVNDTKITLNLDDGGNTLSFLEYLWNVTLGQWENYQKRIYQYDTEGNQIERTIYIWFDGQWNYPMKDIYAYDNESRLSEWTQLVYNEGEWNNLLLYTYTYDNNNLSEVVKHLWRDDNWQLDSRHVYFYDPDNNLLEDYYQVAENDIWYNTSLVSYVYNVDDQLTEKFRFGWSEDHWANKYKSIYAYDIRGNQSTWHTLIWNDDSQQWISNIMHFYYYDENNIIVLDSCQWYRNEAWGLHDSNSYEYNEYDQLSEILAYDRCASPNFQKKSYLYNTGGNELEITLRGLYSDEWLFMDQYLFTYGCGDINNNGQLELLDITYLISYLYMGGAAPDNPESADLNGDGILNITDITSLIDYIYLNGPDPLCR